MYFLLHGKPDKGFLRSAYLFLHTQTKSKIYIILNHAAGAAAAEVFPWCKHICSDPNCSNSWYNNDNRTYNRFAPHTKNVHKNYKNKNDHYVKVEL